jgi:hypothetical protein
VSDLLFEIGSSFLPGLASNCLLISASGVAEIGGVIHYSLLEWSFLNVSMTDNEFCLEDEDMKIVSIEWEVEKLTVIKLRLQLLNMWN